jgi:hypothetical protein
LDQGKNARERRNSAAEEDQVMSRFACGGLSVLAVALAMMGAAPPALAQAPASPANEDHRAHHPDANAADKPAASGGVGMKGMMGEGGMMCGGDMKQMMSMMRDMSAMMSAHSGMMASHVEARIANLKTELKITDAQAPQWNRFAEALRGLGKSMEGVQGQMMQPAAATATLPARLARREAMLSAHLAAVKALKEALDPLYASFTDEQKKIADTVRIGPMGMM